MPQRINHHVADQKNAFARPSLFQKVPDGVFFRDEEKLRQRVGQHTIDFFRHGPVEAAQSRFHVGHGDAHFHCRQRNRNRRIDVPDHQHHIGLVLLKNGFDALQDLRRLRRVRARADFQIYSGRGNAHLAKENVRKPFIIVLAGMH